MCSEEPLWFSAPGEEGADVPLFCFKAGTSTLDKGWKLLAAGRLPLWGSLIMESQSAGRGRLGRRWLSPPGHLYAALRLPLAPPFDGPGASMALALMLAEALEDWGCATELKWPNDLIFEGGKCGGILLEARVGALLAGIGLNLRELPEASLSELREPGAPPPAALPLAGSPADIWATLVRKLILLYSNKFAGYPLAAFLGPAEKKLLWLGRWLRVERPAAEPTAPSSPLWGRLEGLGPEGQLLLDCGGQRYQIWSGSLFEF